MKKRTGLLLLIVLIGLITSGKVYSQYGVKPIEYKIIAEGTDSPIVNLVIVCFNKHFNKSHLSADFRQKYNLDDKKLYKKKMLIEIFKSDKNQKGLDKIELIGISEINREIVVEFNVVNSELNNDDKKLSPFIIVQVPKSRKKIKYIVNGIESGGKTKNIYMN